MNRAGRAKQEPATLSNQSYRAERVKSLFNAEGHGERFDLDIDADVDSQSWNIGVIVGPSGSGKTSIARELWGTNAPRW